jgi:hypothetical protein
MHIESCYVVADELTQFCAKMLIGLAGFMQPVDLLDKSSRSG